MVMTVRFYRTYNIDIAHIFFSSFLLWLMFLVGVSESTFLEYFFPNRESKLRNIIEGCDKSINYYGDVYF